MTDPNLELVAAELAAAKRKHQFFASALIDPTQPIAWVESERQIKQRNSHGPVTADNIILEEIAEAFAAVEAGDLAHARQELAQCAAVCIRAMEQIEVEVNARNTEHTNTTTTTGENHERRRQTLRGAVPDARRNHTPLAERRA